MPHTPRQQTKYLKQLGYRFPSLSKTRKTEAIKDFQQVMGLKPDGIYGPATTKVMHRVIASGGNISPNFRFNEFQCKCGGRYLGCRGIKTNRDLVEALETLRRNHYPIGIHVVSAYRCTKHNKAVGGTTKSQHIQGTAADIPARIHHSETFPHQIHGIGYRSRDGLVRHIDTRPGPITKWVYSS